MDLLKQYNVQFYKQIRNGQTYYTAEGGGLAEFLRSYNHSDVVQEGLDSVNYVLNGGTPDDEHGVTSGQAYSAWFNNSTVKIYPSYGDTEQLLQTIPLGDFKQILELWLAFLNS